MMRRLSWIIPISFALLAVLSLVYRLLFAYVDVCCREMIIENLSEVTGLVVNIGSVNTELQGYTPTVEFSDVMVSIPDTNNHISASTVYVELNVWQSLLKQQFELRGLHLIDTEFFITRTSPTSIRFGGIDQVLGLGIQMASHDKKMDISIHNARVQFDDKVSGQLYHFDNITFAEEIRPGQYQLAMRIGLPQVLGEQLDLTMGFSQLSKSSAWQGRFHLVSEKLRIEKWQQMMPGLLEGQGELTADIWGGWSSKDDNWVSGSIQCRECNNDMKESFDFATNFAWQSDKKRQQLLLGDTFLATGSLSFDKTDFAFQHLRDESSLQLAVEHLSFDHGDVEQFASMLEPWIKNFPLTAQEGELSLAVNIDIPREGGGGVADQYDDINLSQYTMSSLRSAYGKIKLRNAQLTMPQWYAETKTIDEIDMVVRFAGDKTSYEMQFDPFTIRLGATELQSQMVLSDSNGELQSLLNTDITALPVVQIRDWVPQAALEPKLAEWLANAFEQGTLSTAKVEFYGIPSQFPFTDGGGKFFARAKVDDLQLNYRKNREPLRNVTAEIVFNNESLSVTASDLDYYGLHSSHANIHIADILKPYIEIEAVGEGPLNDVFTYLRRAELVDANSGLMSHVEFDGHSRLKLSVGAPLSKEITQPVSVQGRLTFAQSILRLPAWNVEILDITGDLDFDRTGGASNNLSAFFDDRQFTGTVRSEHGINVVTLEGELPTVALLKEPIQHWKKYVDGDSKWRVRLDLPNLGSRQKRDEFSFAMSSDLHGTALHFPSPLAKESDEVREFNFKLDTSPKQQSYQISYTPLFSTVIKKSHTGNVSGHLRFGDDETKSESVRGFSVSGHIPDVVSFNEWRQFSEENEDGGDILASLRDVDVVFDDFLLGNASLGELAVQAQRRSDDSWKLQLDSENLAGEVLIAKGGQQIVADMESLVIADKSISDGFSEDVDVGRLPRLDISAQRFLYGNFSGENFRLMTHPIKQGMRIKSLSLRSSESMISLEGEWLETQAGAQSQLEFTVRSDDYGHLASAWKFSDSIEGEGGMSGNLSWQGSPQEFALAKLKGRVRIDWQKGRLKTVDPGVGRLLGLFNINSLLQRLSVDFKDLLNEGLAYDKLSGDLTFNKGNMFTKNLSLEGPALSMTVKGRTGLAKKDYNQRIEIVPNLSSNLPVAGALLGGPIAGATVFLVERFTNIGSRIDKVITLHYKLSGSWEKPQVKLISAPIMEKVKPSRLKDLLKKLVPGLGEKKK